ncbi:MAG TPA: hypothetical protein EYQ50_25620, partial [Verrucomicrobiales bacterium]|nr:hypothetical protein [Verrucomicrobiales bacterium]
MKNKLLILKVSVSLLLTGFSLNGGVLEQLFWDGVVNSEGAQTTAVEDLRAFPGFPDAAHDSLDLDPTVGFSTERDQGDDYGSLIKGYIVSPVSGDVTFYNASDDNSEFLLSTDADPANLILLGKETGCCTAVFSGDRLEERSGTVTLEVGGIYYFEAIYQEGGGGDWMDVGWELPDGTQEIIPARALLPFPSASRPAGSPQADFTYFPVDQFITESSLVDFQVDLFGSVAGMKFQWKKNGSEIAGANLPWVTVHAELADDGALFTLNVKSDAGNADLEAGRMFITPDFDPPMLVGVRASGDPQGIIAIFSEFVEETSATDVSNYSLSGQSFTISDATLLSDGISVLLSVGSYTTEDSQLSVSNVKDISEAANVIPTNSSADVVFKSKLLASWNFNTVGAKTTDIIGGYSGTLEGDTFFTDSTGSRSGKAGDLSLDFGPEAGDSLVRVENADWLNALGETDQMTVTLWQKLHAVASTSTFWMYSPSSSNGGRGGQAHLPWGNNNIYFDTAGCCDTSTQRMNGNIITFDDYTDDSFFLNWHHFTFVKDGTAKRIYVDGKLFLESVNTNPLPTDFETLMIGSDDRGLNNVLGIIDDFSIFSAALSEADIALLAGGSDPLILAAPIARELSFTTDLTNQTGSELSSVTFFVEVAGTSSTGLGYTWFRDGNLIPNANGPSMTISEVTLVDNGAVFTAEVFNVDGAFNRLKTAEATLTVDTDDVGPQVVNAGGSASFITAWIAFDEAVTADSAMITSNYAITNQDTGESLAVTGASIIDEITVILDTAMQSPGASYQVVVNGVKDTSSRQNPSDDATGEFTAWEEKLGGLSRIAWDSGSSGNNLNFYPQEFRGKGRFDLVNLTVRDDDQGSTVPYFETPNSGTIIVPPGNIADNYKAVLYGWLNPPETGNYRFSIASDDPGELYLSTDESPSNSKLLALEPNWNPVRAFGRTDRRDEAFPENLSDTNFPDGIPLVAGEKYYVEAFFSEGGGGDNLAVSWKIPSDDTPFADGDLPIAGEFLSAVFPPAGPVIEPPPVRDPYLSESDGAVASASTVYDGWPANRAIDGILETSWFAADNDAANLGTTPWVEVLLPGLATVTQVNIRGNREFGDGYYIFAGRIDLFGEDGSILFAQDVEMSGQLWDVDFLLPTPQADVLTVRFTSTLDESIEPGLAELQVLGDFNAPLSAADGAFASSSTSYDGYPASRAIDGDLDTSWFAADNDAANLGTTPFVEVTFPRLATVKQVNIRGNREFGDGYYIFAGRIDLFGEDGSILFTQDVKMSGQLWDVDFILPAPQADVRTVRITSTLDESIEPGLAELEVLGTFQGSPPPPPEHENLTAADGVLAYSSTNYEGYPPSRAIDGILNTSWFAADNDAANLGTTPYVEVLFPRLASVSQVNIRGNREFGDGYYIFAGRIDLFGEDGSILLAQDVEMSG